MYLPFVNEIFFLGWRARQTVLWFTAIALVLSILFGYNTLVCIIYCQLDKHNTKQCQAAATILYIFYVYKDN